MRLAEFLVCDEAGEEALNTSRVDGFLTALAVGPVEAAEAEWWPKMWGEQTRFRDRKQRERLEDLMWQRDRDVSRLLRDTPENWALIV